MTKMKINLIEYFNKTADRFPQKTAVMDATESINFSQLRKKAHILADDLYDFNIRSNVPVAIYLPKSTDAITAILGILYSGNIYAPLDTENPANRIKAILDNLQPGCIITDTTHMKRLKGLNGNIPVLNIDDFDYNVNVTQPTGYQNCIDTDPAYIIHTSGSTGVPKGVVISHRSVFDYIHWAIDAFDINEKEIIGNQAPLVFDNSTLDIHLMFFTGATLCLIPEQLYMFPVKLLDFINEHKVNFVFWVPTILVNVAKMKLLNKVNVPTLKKVLFAGEVMPTKHLNYWIKNLSSEVLFANLYGPTEITVDCTFYIVDRKFDDEEVLPIGKACRNSDILILNTEDKLCNINEEGELCVRGSSLSLGYWRNLEKTKAVFEQNPLNENYTELIYRTGDIVYKKEENEIIFVGRKDNQIKHMGYRIDLGEIEHAIGMIFESVTPCVLYDHEQKIIVLMYESDNEITVLEFRKQLRSIIPKYMIPTQYVYLNKLPLNASGKIDRKILYKMLTQKEVA